MACYRRKVTVTTHKILLYGVNLSLPRELAEFSSTLIVITGTQTI
jgi:hypothetical protein